MAKSLIKIGIIGGSGLGNPVFLKNAKDRHVTTSYGKPSSPLRIGKIADTEVIFLARHGKDHHIPPTHVNYRANIVALKEAGCTHIIATTAVGSLREHIKRGDLVFPDQFIDFTRRRELSLHDKFESHTPLHTPMAEPFSKSLRKLLADTATELKLSHHDVGTVITIEGARFSTKAESRMFRMRGADIINMSIAPEAIFANEVSIPYVAIAMSTDYDCWKEDEIPVTWDAIHTIFRQNVDKVMQLITYTVPKIRDLIGENNIEEFIKSKIRTVPNRPKEGIMFRDITTLLKDPEGFKHAIQKTFERYKDKKIDVVVGIESRGFIVGSILAQMLGVGFVPIRKKGKLPAKVISQEYVLEYGIDKIEIHKDALKKGENVLLVDDLLATGGTMLAACQLVKKLGGKIVECSVIVDLPDLGGKKKLEKAGYKTFALVEFEGE